MSAPEAGLVPLPPTPEDVPLPRTPEEAAPGTTKPKTKKARKPIVIMEEADYEAQQEAASAAAAAAVAKLEDETLGAAASTVTRARKPRTKVEAEPQTDQERMQYFYTKRAKAKPTARSAFLYTPEGDLRIEGDPKIADQTITLRPFSALRPEEFKAIEDTRQAALEAKEAEYTTALAALREMTEQYKRGVASARDVVNANQALHAINLQRLLIAYPERWTKEVENPERRRILLEEPQEMRKMGYDVYLYKRRDMSRQDALGHYREAIDEQVDLPNQGGGGGEQPLLIDSPESEETGIYHPANVHDFVVNETRYALPLQAYEGEHFASLGDETMRSQLLKTRSGRTVRNLVANDTRRPTDALQLWIVVLKAYCEQVPDIKKKLLETGSRKFHVMDPMIPEPVAFADALEKVRTLFRESAADNETGESSRVRESVISKKQQQDDKKGAIIGYRRWHGH